MPDLRNRLFRPCDAARLRVIGDAARELSSVQALFEAHADELLEGDRWFVCSKGEASGPQMLDLGEDRWRPVLRQPGNLRNATLALAAQVNMVRAERAARAFARALWELRGLEPVDWTMVWRFTSWGSHPRHQPSRLPGVRDWLPEPTPLPGIHNAVITQMLGWVAARADWDERRRRGEVPDVDLLGPFEVICAAGVGLEVINDSVIVLTLNDAEVLFRDRAQEEAQNRRVEAAASRLQGWLLTSVLRDGLFEGCRALHRVARIRGIERAAIVEPVLRSLLAAGADPAGVDEQGYLVLTGAQEPWMFELLLRLGVPLEARGANGQTALMQAARMEGSEPLRALLAAGASVHAVDAFGWSALRHAVEAGRAGHVTALLAAGSDPSPPDPMNIPSIRGGGVPDTLLAGLHGDDPEAWRVWADQLCERNDPRGPALALTLGGHADEARIRLDRHPHAWAGRLLGIHPDLERLLQDPRQTVLSWRSGLPWQLTVGGPGREFLEAALALLRHPEGRTVRDLFVRAPLEKLTRLHAPTLKLLDVTLAEPCSGWDLVGTPSLLALRIRGPVLQELELQSPTLTTLCLESPFRRDERTPRLLGALHTPALNQAEFVLASAEATLPWLGMLPRTLRHLRLRPVSRELVQFLAAHPLLVGLTHLELGSMWVEGLGALQEQAGHFAHLHLVVTVLELEVEARVRWTRVLQDAGMSVVVKGASFRSVGRLDDGRPWQPRQL